MSLPSTGKDHLSLGQETLFTQNSRKAENAYLNPSHTEPFTYYGVCSVALGPVDPRDVTGQYDSSWEAYSSMEYRRPLRVRVALTNNIAGISKVLRGTSKYRFI